MKNYERIYMVGNAHLDIMWLWELEEGIQEVRATFRSAIDRLNEYQEFIFTSACASYYEMVEEYDPELFQEIKKAIKKGKWYIAGGWYLQPDCNMPNGESFIRQGLYSQKYFIEKFGKRANVGYNVDSFGHAASLPQLLKNVGLDSYIFMRPNGQENPSVPGNLFLWEGIDGTKIQSFRIPVSYCSDDKSDELFYKIKSTIADCKQQQLPMMCFYGVGDHGGGPTKKTIEKIREYESSFKNDTQILFSDPGAYFEEIRKAGYLLPSYHGELQHHSIGCYSVMSDIKKMHNQSEQALIQSEIIATIFSGTIRNKYPIDEFRRAWKKVLFNEFHDVLSGTCLPEDYPVIKNGFGYALEIASDERNFFLQQIAAKIDTSDGKMRLIVFNSHPWAIKRVVEVDGIFDSIKDNNDVFLPMQQVHSNAMTGGMYAKHTRIPVIVPPFGYCTWTLENVRTNQDQEVFDKEQYIIEPKFEFGNGIVTIYRNNTKDGNSIGAISCLGETFISEIIPVVINDDTDTWAHGLSKFEGLSHEMSLQNISVSCEGEVTTKYDYTYSYEKSTLVLSITTNIGERAIDLHIKLFWAEKHKVVKLRVRTPLENDYFFSEIPYGWIQRPADDTEWPCGRWIGKRDSKGRSLFLLNDGLYGCSAEPDALCLTLLRSPIMANHMPAVPKDEPILHYADQGEHEWNLRLLFIDEWKPEEATREAMVLNQPLVSFIESIHKGILPNKKSYGKLEGDAVVLGSAKRSEKNDGWIFRLIESSGREATAKLEIPFLEIDEELVCKPFEIKTLYKKDNEEKVGKCNGLEEFDA